MLRSGVLFLMGLLLIVGGRNASSQVVINSLSASTVPRSGRVIIQGSGFGADQSASHVEIGGFTALVTRWSDTLVAAYVPEAAPVGSANVQVFAGGSASNTVPLTVTLRQANGRVRWRFQADAPYIFHRPAIGPDGTIIAHDAGGFVYALTPDGGLKWIYKTRVYATGPPSVGADGSVYVGDSTTVTALSSTGAFKWAYTNLDGRALAAGPTVGPDGKIYAFFDVYNVYALTPEGAVAWHFTSTDLFDLFEWGAEFVFGPSQPGKPADQVYLSFGVSPSGFLWAWNMATGALAFTHFQSGTWDASMQPQGQAVTAPDGTIYTGASVPIGSSSSINAFNPDGSLKWSVVYFGGISAPDLGPNGSVYFVYQAGHLAAVNPLGASLWKVFDGVNLLQYPIANPAGGMVFVGGGQNGNPGFVRAYNSANGAILWQIDLGSENGGNQWLGSRPRFAPDGNTVYFGTTIPAQVNDPYCYVYAVDTTGAGGASLLSSVTMSPASVVGGGATTGTVTLSGPAPAGGFSVALKSNKAQVTVPATVTVAAGDSSATFTASTSAVTANLTAAISGTAGGITRSVSLVLLPLLKSVTTSPTSVVGGKSATGTVTLNGPAPAGGQVVTLSTTNIAASIPGSVTVAAGATTATFTVSTTPVSVKTTGTISASALGVTRTTGVFTVKPPALTGLVFTPTLIASGASSTGKLTLNGPAPAGFTVNLSSANSTVAPVPASVTFAAGATTATFTVTGGPVTARTTVTITAKDPALVTRTGTLTVKP